MRTYPLVWPPLCLDPRPFGRGPGTCIHASSSMNLIKLCDKPNNEIQQQTNTNHICILNGHFSSREERQTGWPASEVSCLPLYKNYNIYSPIELCLYKYLYIIINLVLDESPFKCS